MPLSALDRCHEYEDLRRLAKRRLPKGIFEFIDRGNDDEVALRNNVEALQRVKLMPRVAVDVSRRSTASRLLGRDVAMPVGISPTGAAGLVWYEGELALARAAARAGVPFTLAGGSMTAMEKIARIDGLVPWFQCYLWNDRQMTYRLIERVTAAGFEALFVTVDNAVLSARPYNDRNGFSLPFRIGGRSTTDMLLHPGWFARVLLRYVLNGGMPRYVNYPTEWQSSITNPTSTSARLADSLTWEDVGRIRDRWRGKLVVKGVLHPDDAVAARDGGADAVLVSNHGGRNLDSAWAPIEALPAIRAAVGPEFELLVDSGVRRGSDVVKAMALGANGVLVGRPALLGVAAGGEAGASKALGFLRRELDHTMAYMGAATLGAIGPAHVPARSPGGG